MFAYLSSLSRKPGYPPTTLKRKLLWTPWQWKPPWFLPREAGHGLAVGVRPGDTGRAGPQAGVPSGLASPRAGSGRPAAWPQPGRPGPGSGAEPRRAPGLQLPCQTQEMAIAARPSPPWSTCVRASAFRNPADPAKPALSLNKLLPFRFWALFWAWYSALLPVRNLK